MVLFRLVNATRSTLTEQLEGYRLALESFSIAFDPALVVSGDYDRRKAYQCMRRLLRRGSSGLSAAFVANDLMAPGAMECILEDGLGVSEDMAIVGFDNISLISLKTIGLITVAQEENVGRLATQITLEPRLVIRRT